MPNHFHFCCERCDCITKLNGNGDLLMYEDNILFSSVIKHHVFTVQITMYVPFKGQNMQGT